MDSTIKFVLKADTAQGKAAIEGFRQSLKGMGAEAEKTNQKVSGLDWGKLATGATFAAAAAAAALGAIGVAATKMAMDAVESENLFAVSMGDMGDEARAWSQELSKSLGLNEFELRKQVGMFNTMFSSMGLGTQAAYDMSTGLTQLAYDMASFYNLKPEEAFDKLRAGITGEAEPLKRLGILVTENTVKTYAYTHGIAKQGEELTEQQKVMARYGAILAQTGDAQGDLARTMDSPANALRVLRSQIDELLTKLGMAFLPTMQFLVSIFNDVLRGIDLNSNAVQLLARAINAPILAYLDFLTTIEEAKIKLLSWVKAAIEAAIELDKLADKVNPLYKSHLPELKKQLAFVEGGMKESTKAALWYLEKQELLINAVSQVGKAAAETGPKIGALGDETGELSQETQKLLEKVKEIGEEWRLDWLEAGAKDMEEAARKTQQLMESFQAAAYPAEGLAEEIQVLIDRGATHAELIRAYGPRLQQLADQYEEWGMELPHIVKYLYLINNEMQLAKTRAITLVGVGTAEWFGGLRKYIAEVSDALPVMEKAAVGFYTTGKEQATDWGEVWTRQISTIFTDMSEGIAESLVEWEGFKDSGIAIAKEFGKGFIRTMTEQLLSPMQKIFKQIGDGLSGLFSGQGTSKFGTGKFASVITNPWVLAGLGGATALIAALKLTKSEYDKLKKEFARDFGGVTVEDSVFKQFWKDRGIGEAQIEPIRKDLLSSPQWLREGWEYAKQQGKMDEFLLSLEKVQTAWGTFDFREAFEKGLDTKNWDDLNKAFEEAFKNSKALTNQFSDLSKLFVYTPQYVRDVTYALDLLSESNKKYLDMAKDVAADPDKFMTQSYIWQAFQPKDPDSISPMDPDFRENNGVWEMRVLVEQLSDEAAHLLGKLQELEKVMGDTGTAVADFATAGGTAQEAALAFAEAIHQAVQISQALGTELPASITPEMVHIAEAMAQAKGDSSRLLQGWVDLKNAGQQLSDQIYTLAVALVDEMGYTEAQAKGYEMVKDDVIALAREYERYGLAIPPLVQQIIDWAQANNLLDQSLNEIADSMAVGGWKEIQNSGKELSTQLASLHAELSKTKDPMTTLRIEWDLLGGAMEEFMESAKRYGLMIPDNIQRTYDWIKANGGLAESFEGVQTWRGIQAAGQELALEIQALQSELLKSKSPMDAMRIGWDLLGSRITDLIEQYNKYGLEIPDIIQKTYDWIQANGELADSMKGANDALRIRQEFMAEASKFLTTGEISDRMAEIVKQYGGAGNWDLLNQRVLAGLPIDSLIQTILNWIPQNVPQMAGGTNYVPRDMLAVVHKGEKVIPASQNQSRPIQVVFQGPVYGMDDFERQVSLAVDRAQSRGGFSYLQ